MAAGQLAGGLAWLAISGEDAPDLVATAPVPAGWIVRAKMEAVLGASWSLVAALILAHGARRRRAIALVAGGCGIASRPRRRRRSSSGSARRRGASHFRRRQTSSRIATFAEAFSSILWACAAAFAAGGIWILSLAIGIVCGVLLVGVRAMRPAPPDGRAGRCKAACAAADPPWQPVVTLRLEAEAVACRRAGGSCSTGCRSASGRARRWS